MFSVPIESKPITEGGSPVDVQIDSEKFHQIYGDCYISGFIVGGDLHGVASIRVLDSSKKRDVVARFVFKHLVIETRKTLTNCGAV